MNPEREAIRKADADQRLKQNAEDYHNELAGNDVGRIQRFGFDRVRKEAAIKEERRKSAFEQMMLSEAYRAAWMDAMNAVNKAENALYEALVDASNDLSLVQNIHKDLMDNAATTADGTKVFRDKDGHAYNEKGERLSADIAATIIWPDDAPTWEEYSESSDKLRTAKGRYKDINAKSDRLAEIREELNDKDNPLSLDEIEDREQEALDIRSSVDQSVRHEVELKQAQQPAVAPDLNLTF